MLANSDDTCVRFINSTKSGKKHGNIWDVFGSSHGYWSCTRRDTYRLMLTLMGFLGSIGLIVLIIAFIILGICNGFTGPPAMALVGDTVEADDNATGMGFF